MGGIFDVFGSLLLCKRVVNVGVGLKILGSAPLPMCIVHCMDAHINYELRTRYIAGGYDLEIS